MYTLIRRNDVGGILHLLQQGIYIDRQDRHGDTPLIVASENRYYNIVHILLEYGADPNIPNNGRSTALIYASNGGHLNNVMLLLHYGATVNGIQDNQGYTALSISSEYRYVDILQILLLYGARY